MIVFGTPLWKTYLSLRQLLGKGVPQYPAQLFPVVASKRDVLIRVMRLIGHPIVITSECRSCYEQNRLYAQGRTIPGSIITNARCGQSFHNFGVAFDCAFLVAGRPSWSEIHPWETLGKMGELIGLEWGGRWEKFEDRPHFQYTLGHSFRDFQEGNVDYNKLNK